MQLRLFVLKLAVPGSLYLSLSIFFFLLLSLFLSISLSPMLNCILLLASHQSFSLVWHHFSLWINIIVVILWSMLGWWWHWCNYVYSNDWYGSCAYDSMMLILLWKPVMMIMMIAWTCIPVDDVSSASEASEMESEEECQQTTGVSSNSNHNHHEVSSSCSRCSVTSQFTPRRTLIYQIYRWPFFFWQSW